MLDPTASLFCLLFSLTSPGIEANLKDLESPAFEVRRRAEAYLRAKGHPYLFRLMCEEMRPTGLDRKRRVESVVLASQLIWQDGVGAYWDKKWQAEGDLADFYFGTDWPVCDVYSMRCAFDGYFLDDNETHWHSHKLKAGRKELLEWEYDDKHREVEVRLYNDTYRHCDGRRYKYALELEENLWPYHMVATKLWAIDEMQKGTPTLVISIVLAEMKRREYLRQPIFKNSMMSVRSINYGSWVPFVTIHGQKQADVPIRVPAGWGSGNVYQYDHR